MVTLADIMKIKKLGSNHILYLICILKIPFFVSLKIEQQLEYLPFTERTVFRVREDLLYHGVLKKSGQHDFIVIWDNIKKL